MGENKSAIFSKIKNKIISKKIKKGGFKGNQNLQVVVVPDDIDVLSAYCFEDCTNLAKVILPEGLTKVEEGAFKGCENLEEIVIPKTVKSIGVSAFEGCKSLKRVVFQDGIYELETGSFKGCES